MRNSYIRLTKVIFESAVFAALTQFLSSCSTNLPIQGKAQLSNDSSLHIQYSIIFVIHGDGDYLYHDTSGKEYEADEEALAGAMRVAQQNSRAEVFIFHQKPRRHFMFFFPLRDGEFYYYRNGQLIDNELYWRYHEKSILVPEVELYRRYHPVNQHKMVRMFLYFGHEIPEFGGKGYNASYPDRTFTIHDLANTLKDFTVDSAKFDLMILNTCYGGTPYTIDALGSFSHTIIASPDNLYLSYLDLHPLERLDLGLQNGDVPAFANRFAQHAFDRLAGDVQTAVSVAVYDVDGVKEFIHKVYRVYDQTLTSLKEETETSFVAIEHCDCADLPSYVLPKMSEGIDVFYRPARFGRTKFKKNHSGWECWRRIEP
jgi:hypothetical protein